VVLDADGNLWQWSYDSIGTICWGDEAMQGPLPSHAKWNESGLWDLFVYEPALMRGAGKYQGGWSEIHIGSGNWVSMDCGQALIEDIAYSGITGRVVEVGVRYDTDPGFSSALYAVADSVSVPASVLLTGLSSGTWYYYQTYVKTGSGEYINGGFGQALYP
jgi:hypothetical protein